MRLFSHNWMRNWPNDVVCLSSKHDTAVEDPPEDPTLSDHQKVK